MNCPICYKELTLVFGRDTHGNTSCKYVCEENADPHFMTGCHTTPELAAQEVDKSNGKLILTKEETIEELARGVCAISANKGDCKNCGFSKDESCSNYRVAEILYNRGFRKTGEEVEGSWILCPGLEYNYFRCSVCNDWQIKQLPKCRRCHTPMKCDTEFVT